MQYSIVLPIRWIAILQFSIAKLLCLIVWHSEVQFLFVLQSSENGWPDLDKKWWFMQNKMTDLWLCMTWLTAVANDGDSQVFATTYVTISVPISKHKIIWRYNKPGYLTGCLREISTNYLTVCKIHMKHYSDKMVNLW